MFRQGLACGRISDQRKAVDETPADTAQRPARPGLPAHPHPGRRPGRRAPAWRRRHRPVRRHRPARGRRRGAVARASPPPRPCSPAGTDTAPRRAVLLRAAGPVRQRRHRATTRGGLHRRPAEHRLRPDRQGLLPRRRPQGRASTGSTTSRASAPPRSGSPRSSRTGRCRARGADVSAGYHGYWITDFTQVDPHFGTNADLKRLVTLAHQRGHQDLPRRHHQPHRRRHPVRREPVRLRRQGRPRRTRTRRGGPFEDRNYADGTPRLPDGERDVVPVHAGRRPRRDAKVKVPAWLNDPTMYHNRGDSTFAGENSEYGDFFGLDDLWTERPEVVAGMTKIYEDWIGDDRRRRLPARHRQARRTWTSGRSSPRASTRTPRRPASRTSSCSARSSAPTRRSPRPTCGRAACRPPSTSRSRRRPRGYAAGGGSAHGAGRRLRRATTSTPPGDTNADQLPTFLGNHDMGRIGSFIAGRRRRPGQPPAARPARPRADVPHPRPAGRLLRRRAGLHRPRRRQGRPAGHVRLARPPTTSTTTCSAPTAPTPSTTTTPSHPLYRTIAELGAAAQGAPGAARRRPGHPVRRRRPGRLRLLPDRPAASAPSTSSRSTTPTTRADRHRATPGRPAPRSTGIYGGAGAGSTAGADGKLTVTVPPLSAVVLKAGTADRRSRRPRRPSRITAPAAGAAGRHPRRGHRRGHRRPAAPPSPSPPRSATARGRLLGTADHAPYTRLPRPDRPGRRHDGRVQGGGARRPGPDRDRDVAPPSVGTPAAGAAPRLRWSCTTSARPATTTTGASTPGATSTRRRHRPGRTGSRSPARTPTAAFAWVKLKPGATNVGFLVVDKNGIKDVAADRIIDVDADRRDLAQAGRPGGHPTRSGHRPARPPDDRARRSCTTGAPTATTTAGACTSGTARRTRPTGPAPLQPAGTDAFGAVFRVPLAAGATGLSYIIHKGDRRTCPTTSARPRHRRPRGVAARRPAEVPAAEAAERRRATST